MSGLEAHPFLQRERLVAIRRPRIIAGVLRRLASQGDHDLAVDAIST
jgi:hypothetical protein